MKRSKKIISFLIAALLICSSSPLSNMNMTVMAAGEYVFDSWSLDKIESNANGHSVEKKQYRSRNKTTKKITNESSTYSESGWTTESSVLKSTTEGAKSNWTETKITASDTLKVETRQMYKYSHYCDGKGLTNGNYHFAPSKNNDYGLVGPHTIYYKTQKTPVGNGDVTNQSLYKLDLSDATESDGDIKCPYGCYFFYSKGQVTQYRSTKLTKTYEHTLYKYDNWSDWNDEAIQATESNEVQTRTVYNLAVHSFSAKLENSSYIKSEATCITPATYYYKCTGCDAKGTDTYTVGAALGHSKIYNAGKTPTCTEIGWNAYETCSRCSYTTYNEIPARIHEWTWITDKAANCGIAGTKHEACTLCSATRNYGTVIPPSGAHAYTWVTDVQPDCGNNGSKHQVCTVCGTTGNTESIPATGNHNFNGETCRVCNHKCSCNCHKGGFAGFIWKIVNFFHKLFKKDQFCGCGRKHW